MGCADRVALSFSKELEPGGYEYAVSVDGVTGVCAITPGEDYASVALDPEIGPVMVCYADGIDLIVGAGSESSAGTPMPKSVRLQITSGGEPLIDEVYEPHYETHVIECNGTRCKHAEVDVAIP